MSDPSSRALAKALESTQEQSAENYRGMLRWMAQCKVKHDALALAWSHRLDDDYPDDAQTKQIEAALSAKLEVEGEEQWLARTIMLTEALAQYLRVMESEEPDPEELQRAFLRVKERHFVFMPAELAKGE